MATFAKIAINQIPVGSPPGTPGGVYEPSVRAGMAENGRAVVRIGTFRNLDPCGNYHDPEEDAPRACNRFWASLINQLEKRGLKGIIYLDAAETVEEKRQRADFFAYRQDEVVSVAK
jgi:hypothetical protein